MKNGFMHGRQRFKCRSCGYNFTCAPWRGRAPQLVALAVWLHLCGLPQRRIARLVRVSPVAVLKWVKRCAPHYAARHPSYPGAGAVSMALALPAKGATVTDPGEIAALVLSRPPSPGSGRLIIVVDHPSFTGLTGIVIGPEKAAAAQPCAGGSA